MNYTAKRNDCISQAVSMLRPAFKSAMMGLVSAFFLAGMSCATPSANLQNNESFSNLPLDPENPTLADGASAESAVSDSESTSRRITFDWPVNEARMTRGFFTKPKKRRGRPHLGIDLASPKGTPIYAAHSGLIIYVGKQFSGYGRMVMIEGKDGFASLYAHLSKTLVRAGTQVVKGELIGQMGRTGRATGVHLHFEIRKKDGPVDPLMYLPGGANLVRQAKIRYAPEITSGLFDDSWATTGVSDARNFGGPPSVRENHIHSF